MWKALAFKELRDVLPIACIALIAYLAFTFYWMGFPILFGTSSTTNRYNIGVPFLDSNFLAAFIIVSIVFTISLGLWQTVSESSRGTWLFLLHRPAGRRAIIGLKLMAGVAVYLLTSLVPIVIYTLWAATPGTHASPFAWWMTAPVWEVWLIMITCYLGAILTGIRPGRWFGTRLLPLAGAGFVVFFSFTPISPLPPFVAAAMMTALLLCLISYVAKTRDYS